MQSVRPEARGMRPISTRSPHILDKPAGDHTQVAERLIDLGILRSEWRPKLAAFSAGGWLLAREISRISGVEAAFVAVAELAPAWPGGPIFAAAAVGNTVIVDEAMRETCAVSRQQFHDRLEVACDRVAELARELASRELANASCIPDLRGRTAIVVDDGLSTTLLVTRAAIAATRNCGAQRVILVAPATARRSTQQIADEVDLCYCGSLCSGRLAVPRHA